MKGDSEPEARNDSGWSCCCVCVSVCVGGRRGNGEWADRSRSSCRISEERSHLLAPSPPFTLHTVHPLFVVWGGARQTDERTADCSNCLVPAEVLLTMVTTARAWHMGNRDARIATSHADRPERT